MAEVVVEDCSLEETTGARSSMQKPPDGKIVAQVLYASRLSASRRAGLSAGDFTSDSAGVEQKNEAKLTGFT
jgi:hypothetical protein